MLDALLAERSLPNPEVRGSNPVGGKISVLPPNKVVLGQFEEMISKNGPFSANFPYFCLFNTVVINLTNVLFKIFADDWIRTADLMCHKRANNHCPNEEMLL